jgi:hypothetical protein
LPTTGKLAFSIFYHDFVVVLSSWHNLVPQGTWEIFQKKTKSCTFQHYFGAVYTYQNLRTNHITNLVNDLYAYRIGSQLLFLTAIAMDILAKKRKNYLTP